MKYNDLLKWVKEQTILNHDLKIILTKLETSEEGRRIREGE